MVVCLAIWVIFTGTIVPSVGTANSFAGNSSQTVMMEQATRVLQHDIREILADSRFNYPDHWSWFKKIWQTIIGWLTKLHVPKQAGDNQILKRILQWAGIVCLAGLPFILLYFLPKLLVRSGRVKSLSANKPVLVVHPGELKHQAAIFAEKGQYREAIRQLYLTSLEHLKTNGILPDGIRLTDKANLTIMGRAFGLNHPGYQAFKQVVLIFQEKWYGLRNCGPADYHQLIEYVKIMEDNIGKPHV
jgi:hypothetical protein